MLEEESQNLSKKIEEIKTKVNLSGSKIEELKLERTNKNTELTELEEGIINQFTITQDLKSEIAKLDIKKSKLDSELEQVINKMWEEYELTPANCDGYEKPENVAGTAKKVKTRREEIKGLGSINIDAIEEYKRNKREI